ncbi:MULTISPECIES: response regulator [unclassified Hyphomicrobium]|uniref:response regulator n=1 Tax=unclassified Hyphomicrobium TaxID=2619925 RepID=UPI000213EFEF|nr:MULTISPECIES: response regulator [unclassified Hyphomicrobium]CCB67269.1 Response regulator receiver protein [Hyphomicrobium sp. MC1]
MATILLADDDAAVRDLVRRALTSEGHKVQVTQDGLEALDILGTSASGIDILISDVDMPQLDGISLAEQALALKPSLAIVLMSGFSDQLERAARLRARKLLSITKPFTLDQIKQIVRTVLS